MDDEELNILLTVRDYLCSKIPDNVTVESLSLNLRIPFDVLLKLAPDMDCLVLKALLTDCEQLHRLWANTQSKYPNAIDMLLVMGMGLYLKYRNIHPNVSGYFKTNYPTVYANYLNEKRLFFVGALSLNIATGISQGVYRIDALGDGALQEVIAKLDDIYENRPTDFMNLSLAMVFNVAFQSFVGQITSANGWDYYLQRRGMLNSVDFFGGSQ